MSKASRGFASMNLQKRSEISRAGGRAAHRAGKARTWTVEESRVAGRAGGRQTQLRRMERLANDFASDSGIRESPEDAGDERN